VGVPFAASRVCDELAALALDPAPGTLAGRCAQKTLDNADAVIDAGCASDSFSVCLLI
jgi:hypothetical protein